MAVAGGNKGKRVSDLLGLFVVVACAVVYYLSSASSDSASQPQASSSGRDSVPASKSASTTAKPGRLQSSQNLPASTQAVDLAPVAASSPASGNIEERVAALETQIKSLQQALAGVNLERASADRQALFAAEEGYLKADEYAAADQHAIAGEGYLTFLQKHPQHPDARDVMKKARDSFLKAGYKDKAFWVPDEMMKANPQHQAADIEELAYLEKEAGSYDSAAAHMAQAAQIDSNVESRLWNASTGRITFSSAMPQVSKPSGVTNPLLHQRAQAHLIEWQKQLSRTPSQRQ